MNPFEEAEALARQFIAERYLDMSRAGSYSKCLSRSSAFVSWLKDRGITSYIVDLMHPKVPMDPGIDPRWGKEWHELGHYMVLYNGVCIDLSGAQFGETFSKLVWSYTELKLTWTTVAVYAHGARISGEEFDWNGCVPKQVEIPLKTG
jgi:hypothetical protein